MFFIDKPYISDFLKETLVKYSIPVVTTKARACFTLHDKTLQTSEQDAITALNAGSAKAYSTSENAIAWFEEHVPEANILKTINLFKDKAAFRQQIASLYPDFFFTEVAVTDLAQLDYKSLPKSFIIKPTVGFFSMGVYLVESVEAWQETLLKIDKEMQDVAGLYPEQVLKTGNFIIEECIEGEEFAIDAYFDEAGCVHVVGIFQHQFAGADDVSDRVYFTSKELIEEHLETFTALAQQIGKLCKTTNFPMHLEVRKRSDGVIVPIEVNPLRFGGWCTTADCSATAFGFNPYQMYFEGKTPNWQEVLKGKEGKKYCLVVLDNSTGVAGENIRHFDYDKLTSSFSTPLEIRKIDWLEYPVFGFLFAEVSDDSWHQIETILASDLTEFITTT